MTGKFSERTIQQQNAWKRIYGDNGKEDPPVPISNTEVKLFYADGTWLETTWESRKLPNRLSIPDGVERHADIAQLVEHLNRNQRVEGSSPFVGSK